jgi:xanthine dehydrogenase accessory factor
MKDKKVWQFICDSLQQDIPVALLIVVASEGSSPGRVGFKMAVTTDNTMVGTIGGGIIEYKFVNQVQARLKKGNFLPLLQRQVHNQEATTERSGLICGGMQSVVLYPCQKNDLVTLLRLLESLETREGGTLHLSPSGILFTHNQRNVDNYKFLFEAENEWQYEEAIGLINTVYIIGGGHVGLALSRLLALLDFHIVVLDERSDINTFKNNTDAHEKIIISYQNIQAHIPEGEQNYVVIMTPNHRADELVLRQLIDKKLGYLGMMGSASKVKKIIEHLRQDGISPEKLQRLRAPAGLPIKSHTPTEIGISIAAQIISVKNHKS